MSVEERTKSRKKSLSLSTADNDFINKVLAVHGKIIGDEKIQLTMPLGLTSPQLSSSSTAAKTTDQTTIAASSPSVAVSSTIEKEGEESVKKVAGGKDNDEVAIKDVVRKSKNDDFQEYYSPGN